MNGYVACYSILDGKYCDSCLSWCHFKCVGLLQAPETNSFAIDATITFD